MCADHLCIVSASVACCDPCDVRGGAKSSRDDHDVDTTLSPRMRKRRIVFYFDALFEAPLVVFVCSTLTKISVTNLLSAHLAVHHSWMQWTIDGWIWRAVFRNPLASFTSWDDLLALVSGALGQRRQLYLGYRATRAHGLLVATLGHEMLVQRLNGWITTWTPRSFSWNALALLQHRHVAAHRDKHNANMSVACSLSTGAVYFCHTSELTGRQVRASMRRTPVYFDPTNTHAATSCGWAVSVVAYLTLRLPQQKHVQTLRHLGFRNGAGLEVPPAQTSSADETSSQSTTDTTTSSTSDDVDTPLNALTNSPAGCASDLEPLISLVEPGTSVRRSACQPTISPTLPFEQDERGGAPKSAQGPPRRFTWEGESAAQMLQVVTPMKALDQSHLVQIHMSQLCRGATGMVLVNWSSWPAASKLSSSEPLVAILPGWRDFELDRPTDDRISRVDIVVDEPGTGRRFPRAVTLIQLGDKFAGLDSEPKKEIKVPTPTVPVELLLEVDARVFDGTDPRKAS
eukprot:6487087-Amphidinium_carterae.4